MTRMDSVSFDYYNQNVIARLIDKYGFSPLEATRKFLNSQVYQMLEDADMAMWDFSERAIFEMWETEQITGDPRHSAYLRSEL